MDNAMTSSRLADAVAARYSGWWHLSAASSTFPTRSLKHVREHSHELMPSPLRAGTHSEARTKQASLL